MISSLHVLEVISDQISVNILNAIAMEATNSENLMQIFNLTRKQYYDRSSGLLNMGLIRRKKGVFYLTSFGQISTPLPIGTSLSVKALFRIKGHRHIKFRSWDVRGSTEKSHR